MGNKVKYTLQEYADFPYVFDFDGDEVPQWLIDNVAKENIKAEFRSEDYWYMRVKEGNGKETLVAPGDYICYDDKRGVYTEIVTL